jgi:hypothetical protein
MELLPVGLGAFVGDGMSLVEAIDITRVGRPHEKVVKGRW